jgi:zinc protease
MTSWPVAPVVRALVLGVALMASGARAEVTLTLPRSSVEQFTLKNGLRVALEPMPGHPTVAVMVAYEAGWAHDPPGHAGLAHLVEHLTFRGSRHLPGRGIYEQLESVGSSRWSGSTTADLATYYAVVPAEHFALPLWIESERMAFTLESFTQKSLELEQQRVRKELLQRGRTASTFELFINQALHAEGHPYRRTNEEIGDVLAAELSDVSWFFQSHYRPDNAYLIVAGGFPRRAAAVIERYFGSIVNPPGKAPRPRAQRRTFMARERLEVRQPVLVDNKLIMVFPAPELGSDDEAAFELATALLDGSGPWSLEEALIGSMGLAEWVDVDLEPGKFGSFARISVQLRNLVPFERAEAALHGHLEELGRFGDDQALSEVRTALSISAISRFSDPLASAWAHLEELRSRGRPFDLAAGLARMRRVTARDVASMARRYLDPRRRLTARLRKGGPACRDGCVSHEVEGR